MTKLQDSQIAKNLGHADYINNQAKENLTTSSETLVNILGLNSKSVNITQLHEDGLFKQCENMLKFMSFSTYNYKKSELTSFAGIPTIQIDILLLDSPVIIKNAALIKNSTTAFKSLKNIFESIVEDRVPEKDDIKTLRSSAKNISNGKSEELTNSPAAFAALMISYVNEVKQGKIDIDLIGIINDSITEKDLSAKRAAMTFTEITLKNISKVFGTEMNTFPEIVPLLFNRIADSAEEYIETNKQLERFKKKEEKKQVPSKAHIIKTEGRKNDVLQIKNEPRKKVNQNIFLYKELDLSWEKARDLLNPEKLQQETAKLATKAYLIKDAGINFLKDSIGNLCQEFNTACPWQKKLAESIFNDENVSKLKQVLFSSIPENPVKKATDLKDKVVNTPNVGSKAINTANRSYERSLNRILNETLKKGGSLGYANEMYLNALKSIENQGAAAKKDEINILTLVYNNKDIIKSAIQNRTLENCLGKIKGLSEILENNKDYKNDLLVNLSEERLTQNVQLYNKIKENPALAVFAFGSEKQKAELIKHVIQRSVSSNGIGKNTFTEIGGDFLQSFTQGISR